MIVRQSPTLSDRLRPEEKDYLHDIPILKRANELLNQDKPKDALAVLRQLLPGTRKQKLVLMMFVRASQHADEEEYAAVLENFQRLFPDDPSMELLSIDAFALRRDFPGAMKAVNRLDQSVGGDPYLEIFRADLRVAQDDLKGAQHFARRAIEREPSLVQGYRTLLGYSLQAREYNDALARLIEIDRKFHLPVKDLSQDPEYAGFVESPAYTKWLEYLGAKKPRPDPVPTGKKSE